MKYKVSVPGYWTWNSKPVQMGLWFHVQSPSGTWWYLNMFKAQVLYGLSISCSNTRYQYLCIWTCSNAHLYRLYLNMFKANLYHVFHVQQAIQGTAWAIEHVQRPTGTRYWPYVHEIHLHGWPLNMKFMVPMGCKLVFHVQSPSGTLYFMFKYHLLMGIWTCSKPICTDGHLNMFKEHLYWWYLNIKF